MKPSLYLETTIPSYLVARPSRDVVVAGHQARTHEWWEKQRGLFQIFVSQAVIDEAGVGNPSLARRRLELLEPFTFLDITEDVTDLADELMRELGLPPRVVQDAVHMAAAAVNNVDFLLTWNCRHLANALLATRIKDVCAKHGYRCPVICTPDELMGKVVHER